MVLLFGCVMSVDDGGELWLGVIGEKIGVVPEDIGEEAWVWLFVQLAKI